MTAVYLRYVDDFALFADSKRQLWTWKRRIADYLAGLRLTMHANRSQVSLVESGIPWLGTVTNGRSLRELASLFTRLGFTAFGDPAAHIALLHDEVVTR